MILDVPYLSQYKDTKNPEWRDGACGIAALKMVMDFHKVTNLSVDELYQKGISLGGFLEGVGWYHYALAQLAKNLGFKAITRSWNINEAGQGKLKSQGFNDEDLEIMSKEQLEEGIFTLRNELLKNNPIVVPVPRGFKVGGSGHLVVLIGYDDEGFFVNDPDDLERGGEKIKVNFGDFSKVWTKRAVIVQG